MAVFGDTLRQARAHKGVTLKEAEQATRISRHYLLALEEEQFDELPALIYQRGFVRNYATYLNLDPNRLLAMFQQARGETKTDSPLVMPTQEMEVPGHFTPNFAIIAFLVVMSAVVFAWGYSVYFSPDSATTQQEEPIPTVTPAQVDTLFTPPTATPTPPASPTPLPEVTIDPAELPVVETPVTEEPTIDVTEEPTASTDEESIIEVDTTPEPVVTDEAGIEEVTEVPTEEANTEPVSFSFYASVDCELQIIGDNNILLWDQPLTAGDATGYLTATTITVYVDNPDAITIIRADGSEFAMNGYVIELPLD